MSKIVDRPLELCPRRQEIGSDLSMFKVPQTDEWREDLTCSWCGSMSPEYLFEAIEAGCEIGPTDKSYKVYVKVVEGITFNLPDGMPKFYFQHFNEEECIKFIELFNNKQLNIGYPGHFYVIPFFMTIKQTPKQQETVKED